MSNFNFIFDGSWNQKAQDIVFSCIGSFTGTIENGTNYNATTDLNTEGSLSSSISELSDGYDIFESTENYKVDFLLMGSASYSEKEAQSLANKLISVAELRKDAIAFISPYRGSMITDTTNQNQPSIKSASDITDNLIGFYSLVTSSSYAIFDSGYKKTYDRFSNTFRYIPLNGDIAGLCARNDIDDYPWNSPAGNQRGMILNVVKLAYNPTKSQRDLLYSNRINPIISTQQNEIILFGDKTALSYSSAFDRINVRRLFIYIEQAIYESARDRMFEFNDETLRTDFVNSVDIFLREIEAKRGISDYVVICDETNNTPEVIDSNELVADFYIKPARSINFIGLNFIATKTSIDFEEVIGIF